MILANGTDTRDAGEYWSRWHDPMAAYLDSLSGWEDDFAGDFTTVGCGARFGKWLLIAQTTGFLYTIKCESDDAAQSRLEEMFPYDDEEVEW